MNFMLIIILILYPADNPNQRDLFLDYSNNE